MATTIRFATRCAALIAACTFVTSEALADYPDKVNTMVVSYALGGSADAIARGLAPSLGTQLGTNATVDNRPGASGATGAAYVANAKPDGYKVLFACHVQKRRPRFHEYGRPGRFHV